MHTPSQDYPWLSRRMLWFSLLAGPLIWLLHLSVVYAINSVDCHWNFFTFSALGLTGNQITLLVLTLLAAGIVAFAGMSAYRHWRKMPDAELEWDGMEAPREERIQFLTYLSMAMNLLFVVIILIAIVPILSLPGCS